MSIKFYTKIKFFSILLFFLSPSQSFADLGYEEETENMIDTIENISEIEIGQDIQYYDFAAQQYKNAFVNFKDNTASGIRIEVKELETEKQRIFTIDYDN